MPEKTPKPVALFLVVSFFATLLAVFGYDLAAGTYAEVLDRHRPTAATLLDGSYADAVDRTLARDARSMRATRRWWNVPALELFGETPEFVVAGRDGWLFSEPTLRRTDRHPEALTAAREGMADAVAASRALAPTARWVVAVIPSKWRFHEDRVLAPGIHASRREVYRNAVAALESRGMEVLDVLADLERARGSGLFPPNDTHLTREGFVAVTRLTLAPALGIDARTADDRLAALERRPISHEGNLPELIGIGNARAVDDVAIVTPPPANRAGCKIVVFGDSYSYYHDRLFARLVGAVTGEDVDARQAGWLDAPSLRRIAAEFAATPPETVVIFITEQRFAGET